MIKRSLIILTILLASLTAYAQDELTIKELIERLVEQNYTLITDELRTRQAQNNVTPAPFLPTLSATARQSYSSVGTTSNTLGVGASLDWRMFDGLAMFNLYDKSKTELSVTELSARSNLESLVSQVKGQYYFIVSLNSREKVARELVELSRIRYEDALFKYNIQALSGLEMKLAKTDLNADSTNLIRQIEAVELAYIQLNRILNFNLDKRGYVHDSIMVEAMLGRDALERLVQEQNTEILLSKKGGELSELNLKLAKSAVFPTLDFAAGYNYNAVTERPSSDFRSSNGVNFGFTLGVKIFDGLEIRRTIRNAQIDREISDISIKDIGNQILAEFDRGYTNYTNNLQLIDFERENAELMRLNLEVAMERYRLGELSGIDFRNIQQQYLAAVDRQINALYLAKSSEVTLLTLAGMIADR